MVIFCSSLVYCALGKIIWKKTGCCREKGRFSLFQGLWGNSAPWNYFWDALIQLPAHTLASAVHFNDVSVFYKPQWNVVSRVKGYQAPLQFRLSDSENVIQRWWCISLMLYSKYSGRVNNSFSPWHFPMTAIALVEMPIQKVIDQQI